MQNRQFQLCIEQFEDCASSNFKIAHHRVLTCALCFELWVRWEPLVSKIWYSLRLRSLQEILCASVMSVRGA